MKTLHRLQKEDTNISLECVRSEVKKKINGPPHTHNKNDSSSYDTKLKYRTATKHTYMYVTNLKQKT